MPVIKAAPKNARRGRGRGNSETRLSAQSDSPPAGAMEMCVRPLYKSSRHGYNTAPVKNVFMLIGFMMPAA